MSSNGKVALITGSSRGIGAAVAQRLAADGFKVVVTYSGSTDAAEKVAGEIRAANGEAIVVKADVTDPTQVAAMFDTAEHTFGSLDVVVNSAGLMKLTPVIDYDDATFDQMVAVNLKGTFNSCREAVKRLPPGGRLINLSSSVVGLRLPTYGVYIAAKAAVEGLTQVLAQEMRGRNISVNAVAPGPTTTELFFEGKSPDIIDRMAKLNPMERLGTPEDAARIVSFLAGPEGAWINGQTIRSNGGQC